MSYVVVIPSKLSSNLLPCVAAIKRHQKNADIVVIDDGLDRRATGCYYIDGKKPFVFAANVNLGILAFPGRDVIVHNDDALLATSRGFDLLAAAASDTAIGLVAASTNITGCSEQKRRGNTVRLISSPSVPFICVYIPRRVIDAVGLLDERFTAYGWEDNDYCKRIRMAGLAIAVHDGVFVDHGSLRSTFRGLPHSPGRIAEGKRIYEHKWGTAS